MRFPLLLALVSLSLRAQPTVVPWATPDDGTDWSQTQCLTRLAETVCRYPRDPGSGFTFELSRGGESIAGWENTGWGFTGFRAFSLDRDEEGVSPEHILIANNDAVSNGLGVAYWTLYMLAADSAAGHPASAFSVEEFGAEGESFGVTDDDLVLWATAWMDGPDPSGQRGPGLYLVGRPFRVEAGRLVPVTDLPIRARRLLDSFARERGSTHARPVAWLSHRNAETRSTDPYLVGRETTTARGVIDSVATVQAAYDTANWELRVRLDDGSSATYTYAFGSSVGAEQPFTHFGDAATGRLYPSEYRLADAEAWLVGRRVRVAIYEAPYQQRTVLWLE